MQKKIFILVLVASFVLLSGFKVNALKSTMPLIGKVIVIDPGHGGKDPGTLHKDTYEKDIVLKISLYLEKYLAKEGATTILTRNGDYDLSKPNATYRKKSDFDNRIKLINNSNSDMYLSIHLNYLGDSKYSGAQVFYDKDNLKLAEIMQETFNEETDGDREIKKIPSTNYMYNKLAIPGLLIECGFLSNYNERNKLLTDAYQQKIAETITLGVIEYYN